MTTTSVAADRFRIRVPEAEVADLHRRLLHSKFVDDAGAKEWDLGTSASYLMNLVDYWRSDYSWRQSEQRLNELPNYRVQIDDIAVQFLWFRSRFPGAVPILVTHGWPGSFYEFNKVGRLLADRTWDGVAFDVIAPSLPGFAFSSLPAHRSDGYTADLWVALMDRLGYRRFVAHGGDLGAGVSESIARRHPERLQGLHLTSAYRAISRSDPKLTAQEAAFLDASEMWGRDEWAYGEIQGSKPATVAAALADSPVGLAAWMLEKYRTWSDCGGDLASRFSNDDLLTTICIYWFTRSIFRSFMPYVDGRRHRYGDVEFVDVPTGLLRLPADIPSMPPESSVRRRFNVVRYETAREGGHFPALEVPELLSAELAAFAASVEGT